MNKMFQFVINLKVENAFLEVKSVGSIIKRTLSIQMIRKLKTENLEIIVSNFFSHFPNSNISYERTPEYY